MKNTKRAERRAHRERLIRTRSKKIWWIKAKLDMGDVEFSGVIANTPCPCSCHMCCNERRSPYRNGVERLTMQERKDKIDAEEQVKEFYESLADKQVDMDIDVQELINDNFWDLIGD